MPGLGPSRPSAPAWPTGVSTGAIDEPRCHGDSSPTLAIQKPIDLQRLARERQRAYVKQKCLLPRREQHDPHR